MTILLLLGGAESATSFTDIDIFRTYPQRTRWYLAVHQPASVFSSKIAVTPDTYPASALKINGVFNTGDSTLASKNMTVWIGSLPGGSDEGKIRLRAPITSSVIQIAESGCALNRYTAGNFITVVREFAPWPKMPRYDTSASQWRMDYNEAYTNQLENYGPLTIIGPPFAGFLNGGALTASFVGGSTNFIDSSESTSEWVFPDGQTESRIGTEASVVAKTFTGASPGGSYYSYAATDANGVSQITRRLGYIFDDRAQPAQVEFSQISGGIQKGGYQGVIRVVSNGTANDFPDGAEILIFEESSYAGMASTIGGNYPFRTNIVARGWITDDTTTINPFSGDVTFKFTTVDGVLNKTHSKDIFHANTTTPTGTSEWIEATNWSIDRAAIDLVKHRSTIMEITDFHVASGLPMEAKIAFQDLPKSSLWKQLRTNYTERGVRGLVATDLQGNIYATEDTQISGLSANLPLAMTIGQGDRRDVVQIPHTHYDKNALVELYSVGASIFTGASDSPGKPSTREYIGARSPGGNAHGYFGGTTVHERGLVADSDPIPGQQRLTTWSGNLRAKLNNPFPKIVVPLAGNIKHDAIPQHRVQMSLSSTENVRGLDWANKQFLPYATTLQYSGDTGTVLAAIEMESIVDGKGGSAITFERIVQMPPQPTTIPPSPGFSNGSLIAFNDTQGTFMRTAAWVNINTGLTGTNLQDFHGGKSGTNNVIYKCVAGAILKTENDGTTWVDVTPGSDPDGSAASAVDYIWYEPDPTDNTKHYFLARNEIGGTWNSWLLYKNSSASTNTWATLGGGGGAATIGTSAASYNQSYNLAPELFDGATENPLALENKATPARQIAGLDASNAAVVFIERSGLNEHDYMTYAANVQVVSDGSLNSGSKYTVSDAASYTAAVYIRKIPTTSKAAIVLSQYDSAATGSENVWARVVQNSGGSLVMGTPVQVSDAQADRLITSYSDPAVATPNGSELIFTFSEADGNWIRRGTITGTAITLGPTIYDFKQFQSNDSPLQTTELDGDKIATVGMSTGTDASLYAWLHDLDGASIVSTGHFSACATAVNPQNIMIVNLHKNLFVAMITSKTDVIQAYPCSAMYAPATSVTFGAPYTVSNDFRLNNSVQRLDDNNFILTGDVAASAYGLKTMIVNVSTDGTSMNAGPETAEIHDTDGGSFSPINPSIGMLSIDKGMMFFQNNGSDFGTIPVGALVVNLAMNAAAADNGKALGMSISGTGGTAYTTYTNDTNLKLEVTAVPTLASVANVDLGVGTVNQATSNTQVAYPQTIASDDNFAYVFGRMSDPAGLSADPVHIIKTEDRGTTFTTVESSWGENHCGAIARQGKTAYAMRNISGLGAFYTLSSGNTLNSVAPFSLNPGGMLTTADGYVMLGASTPETDAVRYSVSPFTRWYRLRGYANSGGVTGLTLLS